MSCFIGLVRHSDVCLQTKTLMSCPKKQLEKLSDDDALGGDPVKLLTFEEFQKFSLKTRVSRTLFC